MKYRVWVKLNIGEDAEGEYSGIHYDSREDAEKECEEAKKDPAVMMAVVEEV